MDAGSWTSVLFVLTTAVTVWVLVQALHSPKMLVYLLAWAVIQTILALAGFFKDTQSTPPFFLILPLVPILGIIWLFLRAQRIPARSDLRLLTLIHTVRLPVEITLYGLFLQGLVPELMTFTGQNPDIIMGLTAPLVYWLCFRWWREHPGRSRGFLIVWNICGLLLLANIVIRAVLAVPTGFQQWGFEQPNVAVTFFPYVMLPGLVVPAVLLSHLVSLWLLMRR